MDESRSLISFQIAGLLIQNSFRYLLNAMKSFNRRRLFKAVTIWKHFTINKSASIQMKIKNSIALLHIRLRNLDKMLECKTQIIIQDLFGRILIASKEKEFKNKLLIDQQNIKISQEKELQSLSKNLKSMQDNQEGLEKTLKKIKSREENSKTQAQEISNKKIELKNKRKIAKEKDEDLSRIQDIKEENLEIKEKIALIQGNISRFLNEIGGLVETLEEPEKSSEKRKSSNKKVKFTKKNRGTLCTVDLSKLGKLNL